MSSPNWCPTPGRWRCPSGSLRPTSTDVVEVEALWQQIQAFAGQLGGLSYAEIHARLTDYEQQLADIVEKYAPPAGGAAVASGSPTASPSGSLPTPGETGSSAAGSG